MPPSLTQGSCWWTDANRLMEFHRRILFCCRKIWNVSLTLNNTICNSNLPRFTSLSLQWTKISSTQNPQTSYLFADLWSTLKMQLNQYIYVKKNILKHKEYNAETLSYLHIAYNWVMEYCLWYQQAFANLIPALTPEQGRSCISIVWCLSTHCSTLATTILCFP